MRWRADEPKVGEIRCRYKFAWWPTRVDDQIVWLEHFQLYEAWENDHLGCPKWTLHQRRLMPVSRNYGLF